MNYALILFPELKKVFSFNLKTKKNDRMYKYLRSYMTKIVLQGITIFV